MTEAVLARVVERSLYWLTTSGLRVVLIGVVMLVLLTVIRRLTGKQAAL